MQQRGRVVTGEQGAIEVGQLAVEAVAGPQQRDDRLQVAVGHVAHVEADQRGARRDRPRRGPALAPDAAHRRARRPARARAAGGADRDVERDEQRHAEADEHEVERGDVVGVAERHPAASVAISPTMTRNAATIGPASTLRRRGGCAAVATARAASGGVESRDRLRAASASHRQAGVGSARALAAARRAGRCR